MKLQKLIVVLVTSVALVGLFFYFKPSSSQVATAPSHSPQIESKQQVFELEVKNKKLVSGPETIQVKQGDEITIKITSDVAEEFHLHGFDKSIELTAGRPAELVLVADKTGRFEFELEFSRTGIGALEVSPK